MDSEQTVVRDRFGEVTKIERTELSPAESFRRRLLKAAHGVAPQIVREGLKSLETSKADKAALAQLRAIAMEEVTQAQTVYCEAMAALLRANIVPPKEVMTALHEGMLTRACGRLALRVNAPTNVAGLRRVLVPLAEAFQRLHCEAIAVAGEEFGRALLSQQSGASGPPKVGGVAAKPIPLRPKLHS